jgi:cytochrome b-561
MSLGLLLFVQSALVLQPTHTASQKLVGQRIHASLNTLAFLCVLAGFIVIQYNKGWDRRAHFHSPHAYMGFVASILVLLQATVGVTMWATPKAYGGEERAKRVWKYHRWSGYTILTLMLATVTAAARTPYVQGVLHIKFWAVLMLAILTLVGVVPRIQKRKLGFN